MAVKLSQKVLLFTACCCFLFVLLVSSIFWSSKKIEQAFIREDYAQQVDNYTNALKHLIISDNIYPQLSNNVAWLKLQNKLTQLLSSAPQLTPHQQTIQNSIDAQNRNLKRLLQHLKGNHSLSENKVAKRHFNARIIAQLESIRSDSNQLFSIIQKDIQQTFQQEAVLLTSMLIISVITLLLGAFKLNFIFNTSLKEVINAIKHNHSGHFQKIHLSHQSQEFGEIVSEFNNMNQKLSETMVSLDVMKKVVAERTKDLELLSKTDPLTQVANRRALFERGKLEFSRVSRTNDSLTLILLDCDLFKNINDQYGHLFGDELLKHICRLCINEIRDVDFLGRYGGEEFIIILPNCDTPAATEIAKRIQHSLAEHSILIEGKKVVATLSMGISTLSNKHKTFEQLIQDADNAMYQAKQNGRNRIEVARSVNLH